MEKLKDKKVVIIGIALLFAAILMIYFGKYDLYLYIDETLSYTAANNPDGLYYTTADRTWHEGEDFLRPLTAQEGHLFDYGMVWRNQASDTHPPFYHVLLHTLCSFFPGQFSKWFGISINIVAMLIIAILAYRIGLILFKNNWVLSLCGMIAYLVSISTITQVTFIRMYVVLQIFTSAILYLHLLQIENRISRSWKFWIGLYLVTVFGTMTQYYYLIFAFFLAGGYCVYLLFQKKWKDILGYILVMIVSAVTVLAVFPAIVTHLFHKEVGEIAVSNAMNLPNIRLRLATMFGAVSEQIFGNQCKLFIAIAVVFIAVYIIRWLRERQLKNQLRKLYACTGNLFCISWGICIETALFYFIVVSLITPYLCERYLSPIFMIVILLAVGVAYYMLQTLLKSDMLPYYLVVALAMAPMLIKLNGGLEDTSKIEMLRKAEEYTSVPCVVFDDLISTENFMELEKYQKLYYIQDSDAMKPIDDELIETADELVVYIPNEKDVDAYIQKIYDCNPNLNEYERLYVGYGTIAYVVR